MINPSRLRRAFAGFIKSRHWDLFIIITFHKTKDCVGAKRAYKHFFKHVNTKKESFFDKYILSLILFEAEGSRDGVHIHSLVTGINPSYAPALELRCNEALGNSVVLPYNSKKAARFYLGNKYTSPKLVDYDFLRINSRIRGGMTRGIPIS